MSTIDTRLDELAALSDGWLDGEVLAPTPHAIATARAVLRLLPDAPRPHLFPTPEGEVSAEWIIGRVSADACFPAQPGAIEAGAVHVDDFALTRDATADDADHEAAASVLAAWLRGVSALARVAA